MEWKVEPAALDWASERLAAFDNAQVTSLVPGGFEAYARVLHPAVGDEADETEQPCRWSEVAAWSGTDLGPSSRFEEIAIRPGLTGGTERWPGGVRRADLGPDLAAALVELLRPATTATERCWFAVWEGYGWLYRGPAVLSTAPGPNDSHREPDQLPAPVEVRDGPRAALPSRSYVLYTGALEDALALGDLEYQWRHQLDLPGVSDEVADLWWPESQAWFVGADTDLYSTYIGATRETINRLLADPRLEALPVTPDDRLA